MAVMGGRIRGFRLRCASPAATADFYRQAFGCLDTVGPPGELSLRLGEQAISLRPTATSLDAGFAGNETGFQHLAIVVADMRSAMDQLYAVTGWTPISQKGPETLPPASGGATAFKFRDPEAHPLELLQFPHGAMPRHWQAAAGGLIFLGIDHSAISITDTARSVAYYASLGFTMGKTQINQGIEQSRLDGLKGAVVEVTPMAGDGQPHLEFLRYRHPEPCSKPAVNGSTAATELVLALSAQERPLRALDPDGHRLSLSDVPSSD